MTNTKNNATETRQFEELVLERAIDKLKDGIGVDEYGYDLHNKLFNEDYFVIGYYQAEQMLLPYGVFNAIKTIQTYEKDNFGEINTDLGSSEIVANMLAYILGEKLLQECPTVQKHWDKKITANSLKTILKEVKAVDIGNIQA